MQHRVETAWPTIELLPEPRPPGGKPPGHREPSLVTSVLISDLVLGYSPRLAGENAEHVRVLTEADAALPPILVHRRSMRVIDGLHRVRAACARGERTICARFFDGTEDAAFVLAVESNIAHGLPLTIADRKAAAARIIGSHGHWSDRAIAASTGLSARTVRILRQTPSAQAPRAGERIGQDGRSRPLSIAQARILASEIMTARPSVTLRMVAEAAGVSVGTAHDVRKRMQRGADPVPAKQRAAFRPEYPNALRRTGRPAGLAQNRDLQVTLECLRNDPSVRFTDAGRATLRWLCGHAVEVQDWESLLEGVPPHCADMVAGLARRSAEAWQQLARELEQRGGTPS